MSGAAIAAVQGAVDLDRCGMGACKTASPELPATRSSAKAGLPASPFRRPAPLTVESHVVRQLEGHDMGNFFKDNPLGPPNVRDHGNAFRWQFEMSVECMVTGSMHVYRVVQYLASGGFAHVFLAKQVLSDQARSLGNAVAVKFFFRAGDQEIRRLDERSQGPENVSDGCTDGPCLL